MDTMNENTDAHVCEHAGCTSADTDEYRIYTFESSEPLTEWLCFDHAITNGFCVWCQTFGAGSDDYDFSGHRGYHRDCWDELRAEAGEDIEDSDDEAEWDGWEYPAAWYDPDSPVSALEPDDTPRSHYIGPGSEYAPEGEE